MNTTKSKLWALLLCVLVCFTLSACGGESAPEPGTTPETSPNPDPSNPDPNNPDPNNPDPGEQPSGPPACTDLAAQPNSFYLSPDGDDTADGRAPATAWQSLAKLQSAAAELKPGDSVLFERGAVFVGSLELSLAGNPSQPITFGSYCKGDAPVLSGFNPIDEWQAASANIWEAACEDCDGINLLSLDGAPQGLARWPNLDAENEGYLSYDSFAGKNRFADAELAETDWTGAEAVVRTRPWVLDRLRVTSSQGGAIELADEATYDFVDVAGYFMQNHPAALDKNGEWTHDADAGTLKLFLDSGEPAERVSIGTVAVLVNLMDSEHVILEDLVLEGANSSLVQGASCKSINFEKVTFRQSGGQGAELSDCEGVNIVDSRVENTFDSAFILPNCKDCLVQNNMLETIAMVPGMGGSGNHRYLGIELGGPNSVFEYNRVKDVGYIPVTARSNTTVRYNEIDGFQSVKIDGGGIYTFDSSDIDIHNNIVVNGRGTNTASPWESTSTNGIYVDQRSRNVNVYDNTFAFTSGSGIKLHSAQNITLENNTVFAAREAAIELIEYVEPGKLLNNTVKNNQFVTETSNDYLLSAPTPGGREFFDKLGTFSDNRYCAPFARGVVFAPFEAQGANQMFVDFDTWRALHDQDEGSSLCTFKFNPYNVKADLSENLVANGSFDSADGWFADFASTRLESVDAQLKVTLGAGEIQGNAYARVGALAAGDVYRLRFDARSESANASVKVRLRDDDSINNFWPGILTPHEVIPISDTVASYELFLSPDASVDVGRVWFGLADRDAPVYLDNIELVKVDATPQAFRNKARLELNPSRSAKTVRLDAAYQDLAGETYAAGSSVRLEPYGSLVLFRND